MVAQSISGGGGFVSAAAASFDDVTFVRTQAPNSANDATVTVEGGASIGTSGDGAVGILAQTVSGGGGVAADLTLGLTPFYSYYNKQTYGTKYRYGDDYGIAERTGDVTVKVEAVGTVSTTGKYAHGIVAQAIAGSGGIFTRDGKTYAGSLGRFNNTYDTNGSGNNQSGSVSVTVDGRVTVADPTAWAIWAQATGEDLTVTVGSGGTVTGSQASGSDGKYAGGAIFVSGADKTTMTLDNSGTVTGNVVRYKFADDTEELQETAIASVTKGKTAAVAGQALFLNQGSGTFATGAIADVDAVRNAGSMDLGGEWNLIETTGTGDLVGFGTADAGSAYDVASIGLSTDFSPFDYFRRSEQKDWRTATSSRGGLISGLDVDMEHGLVDKLLVGGNFAGTWGVDVNGNALLPNTRTEFLKVSGSDTSNLSILPSLVFDFTDVTTSSAGWTGFSVASAHFADNGVSLGRNGSQASSAMQQAWNRIEGGSATEVKFGADEISLGQVLGALHQSTPATFSDMLLETISQTAAAPLSSSPSAAISAANSVLSCLAFEASGVMMDEGSCVWSRALGGGATQDSQGDAAGYTQSTGGLQIGGQKELGVGWFLGSGLTYESSWFRNDSGSQKLDQDSFVGAVALKKEVGPWLFGLVGGGGYNWRSSKRYINLDTLSAAATGNPDSAMVFGRFRASYEIALGDAYYMRPRVDLDVINMHLASPYISKLAPEDRCHLNGLAMENGVPRFVTSVSTTDIVDGWRNHRRDGGVIVDVQTDEIMAEGLSMPHSPRLHQGALWFLYSGNGYPTRLDLESKKRERVAFLPGFLRGLSFHAGHAAVGLSLARRAGVFSGLNLQEELEQRKAEAWRGVQIVNTSNGDIVEWLRLDGGIKELFDVRILPGVRCPMALPTFGPDLASFITIEAPDPPLSDH